MKLKKDRRFLNDPLNLVGVQGFEPWTPWSQTRCATGLRYTPRSEIILRTAILVNRLAIDLISVDLGFAALKDFARYGTLFFGD